MLRRSLVLATIILVVPISNAYSQQLPKIVWAPGFPKKIIGGTINLKGTYDLGYQYKLDMDEAEFFIIAKNGNDVQVKRTMKLSQDPQAPATKGSFGGQNGEGFAPFGPGPWLVSIRISMRNPQNNTQYFLYSSYVEIK